MTYLFNSSDPLFGIQGDNRLIDPKSYYLGTKGEKYTFYKVDKNKVASQSTEPMRTTPLGGTVIDVNTTFNIGHTPWLAVANREDKDGKPSKGALYEFLKARSDQYRYTYSMG